MAKKNFTGGLNSLLGDTIEEPKTETVAISPKKTTKKVVAKNENAKETTKNVAKISKEISKAEAKENEIRATFIVDKNILEKFKAIAYWERILIKDVISDALTDAIAKYTKKNGEIKPLPKK